MRIVDRPKAPKKVEGFLPANRWKLREGDAATANAHIRPAADFLGDGGPGDPQDDYRRPWNIVCFALAAGDGGVLNLWDVLGVKWAGFQARADWREGLLERVTITCPRHGKARWYRGGAIELVAPPVLWARNEDEVGPTTDDIDVHRNAVLGEVEQARALLANEIKPRGRAVGQRDSRPRRRRRVEP